MQTDRTRYYEDGYINVIKQDGSTDKTKLPFKFNYEDQKITQLQNTETLPNIHIQLSQTVILTNTSIEFATGSVIFGDDDIRIGSYVTEELSFKNKRANKYNGRVKNSKVRRLILQ